MITEPKAVRPDARIALARARPTDEQLERAGSVGSVGGAYGTVYDFCGTNSQSCGTYAQGCPSQGCMSVTYG